VRTGDGERLNDIVWLALDGNAMEDDGWDEGAKAIGMYLNGDGIAGKDARGGTITDDHFLLYFNADGPADVTLPSDEYADAWDVVIDTGGAADAAQALAAGSSFHLETHSLVVLREHAEPEKLPDHSVAASLASLADTGTTDATPGSDQRHRRDRDRDRG
jgi:glycogen operon protein